MYQEIARELLHFIDNSPSCFHVIENIKKELVNFQELKEEDSWKLQPGGSYYVSRNDSSLIAFSLPESSFDSYRIAAAHSDCPSFKIKANPEMTVEKHYTKLNVEKYGGMILSSWLDRPLSAAGRLILKKDGKLLSKTVNIDRDLFLIPNVAIHMNRKLNDGYVYNPQIDMLPLFGSGNASLLPLAAKAAHVKAEEILAYDLFLYNRQKGVLWGANEEFISSRSLDDLQSVYGILKGFSSAQRDGSHISICAVFDNEEVGSLTKQGADSTFLRDTMDRIEECLAFSTEKKKQMLAKSFMLSADNAHALHPNHPELADPTNRPYLNEGIVIKHNANQKYTTDAFSEAVFRQICEEADVPVQTYTNRSDIAGGSTLGNLSNRHISLNTVDIGLPQLAMHSSYESAGVKDTAYLIQACKHFYSKKETLF